VIQDGGSLWISDFTGADVIRFHLPAKAEVRGEGYGFLAIVLQ